MERGLEGGRVGEREEPFLTGEGETPKRANVIIKQQFELQAEVLSKNINKKLHFYMLPSLLLSGKLCSPTFALHKGKILQIRQAIT
jgi:hypothetical protein